MTVVSFRKNFRNPEDLERKFKSWDADGDGKITLEELRVSTRVTSIVSWTNELLRHQNKISSSKKNCL